MNKAETSLRQADPALLPLQGRVVAGFSGGADSTALAHWLLGQAGRVGYGFPRDKYVRTVRQPGLHQPLSIFKRKIHVCSLSFMPSQ